MNPPYKAITPKGHNVKIPNLIDLLNTYFHDVVELKNPILYNKTQLLAKENHNEPTLKQQYHIAEEPNLVLRFDHTYPLFIGHETLRDHVNLRNVGPVFRNDFRSSYRWRQFYQYDLDYLYADHQLRPLLKAIAVVKQLNIPYTLLINDLSILRSVLPDQELKEQTIKQVVKEANLGVNYTQRVLKKNSMLALANVTVDPTLIRGWAYYTDLVFEFTYQDAVCFLGGGVYQNKYNKQKYLGLSFGLNRIIKIQEAENVKRDFDPLVLIYNKTNEVPYLLLDALELNKIPYCLKSKRQGFKQDLYKINSAMTGLSKNIINTVIVGDKQLLTNTYDFKKDPGSDTKNYTLAELIDCLKKRLVKPNEDHE